MEVKRIREEVETEDKDVEEEEATENGVMAVTEVEEVEAMENGVLVVAEVEIDQEAKEVTEDVENVEVIEDAENVEVTEDAEKDLKKLLNDLVTRTKVQNCLHHLSIFCVNNNKALHISIQLLWEALCKCGYLSESHSNLSKY